MNRSRLINGFGNGIRKDGKFVVYWCTRDQRIEYNYALKASLAHKLPVVVYFGLNAFRVVRRHPLRNFEFMVDGLQEMARKLAAARIPMVVGLCDPSQTIEGTFSEALLQPSKLGGLP